MKSNQSLFLDDNDLSISNLTWGIFLISVVGLFLELLFIRWIGTEIRIFAYLQNTILVVCFIGLGLGMFTSSSPIEIKKSLIPLTFLLSLMAIPIARSVLGNISEMLSVLDDLVIWYSLPASNAGTTITFLIFGLLLTYFLLALIVDIFVPIGRILGRLIDVHPNPIWAYSINIAGSIIGSWGFVLLSYFYQPPLTWFLVVAVVLMLFILRTKKEINLNLGLLVIISFLAFFAGQNPNTIDTAWSPYQKLTIRESNKNEIGDYVINVNNVGYQEMIDLSDPHVTENPTLYPPELKGLSQYDLPYLFYPNPGKVLIVGAGSGNDAAGALRNGVEDVVAVDIDPAIITWGKTYHPEKPYSSSNVRVVIDDARSFFSTTNEKFDVISFGLLDSHTTTSLTNARLDHYVYTVESISQAKSLLNENGVMVLNFYAQKPFIINRIYKVLEDTFHQKPIVLDLPFTTYGRGGTMFITGNLNIIENQISSNERLNAYIKQFEIFIPEQDANSIKGITDDWPYLYLESPKIPALYYILIVLIAFVFFRSTRKWKTSINFSFVNRSFWHFFFLGSAFLLLEVQNISKAAVVLGSTWQVNAIIITSILGMALLANWIAYRFSALPLTPVYILLIGTCLGLYFVDLAGFAFLPYSLKAVIVGSLTSLPMLFSGIVFTRSFAASKEKSVALGANLIGSVIGALLQSITFVTGIKTLLLIVAIFYAAAAWAGSKLKEKKT